MKIERREGREDFACKPSDVRHLQKKFQRRKENFKYREKYRFTFKIDEGY